MRYLIDKEREQLESSDFWDARLNFGLYRLINYLFLFLMRKGI
jgi:hypothetical protein